MSDEKTSTTPASEKNVKLPSDSSEVPAYIAGLSDEELTGHIVECRPILVQLLMTVLSATRAGDSAVARDAQKRIDALYVLLKQLVAEFDTREQKKSPLKGALL